MGFKLINGHEGCDGQAEVEAKHEDGDFGSAGSEASIERGI